MSTAIHFIPVLDKPPSIEALEIKTKESLEHVKNTIKIWKEAIETRLGISRIHKDESKERLKKFEEDCNTRSQYKDVICFLQSRIDQKLKTTTSKKQEILALRINDHIQAIAAFDIKENELYLANLASAPWNIRMHASVPPEYKDSIFKGGGKLLVLKCYQIASKLKKRELTLQPLDGSFSFYSSIGMIPRETSKEELSYIIRPETPPALLSLVSILNTDD